MEYDIFISYSHDNNRAYNNWIHVFCERLTDDYFSRVGRKPKIFLDKGDLRAGDALNGKIAAALDQSLLFIPVLSPVYLSSKWCRKEFLYFMDKHKKRLVLDNSSRIVPLKFMPYEDYVPESAWASEVKTIMDFLEGKEILYKDFYRDLLPMPTNHADFMAEVANFSKDIKQLIKKLDSLIGIIDEVPSTPTIYLGYAFGEGAAARALREGLFREWEKQQKYGKFKHRILPDSDPNAADFPRNKSEAKLREFIQQQLKQSDYAILVFDDVEGAKTTDTEVPVAHLQYQLALEESRNRPDFKVIVASQYSEDCASSQRAFIRQIEKDADTNECIRLVDGFEVKLIHNYLVDLTKEPSQPPTGDTRFAFYIYDSRDLEHQPYKTIKDIISQQGILPLSDSFREDVLNGPNDFFKKFWMISNYAIILLHHGETKFCFASLVDLLRVKADKQIPSHLAICVTDPDAQKRLKELYGSPYCEIIDCTQPNFEAQVVNFLKNTGHA